jgi:hypothetical protein
MCAPPIGTRPPSSGQLVSIDLSGSHTSETGLSFGGKWKIILGAKANAEWHWSDTTRKPPTELVKWLASNDDPYLSDVVKFLVPWAFWRVVAFLRGLMLEERVGEREDLAASASARIKSEATSSASGDEASDDRWAARTRQLRAAGGLLGVYICWTVFAYFICAFSQSGLQAKVFLRELTLPPQSSTG